MHFSAHHQASFSRLTVVRCQWSVVSGWLSVISGQLLVVVVVACCLLSLIATIRQKCHGLQDNSPQIIIYTYATLFVVKNGSKVKKKTQIDIVLNHHNEQARRGPQPQAKGYFLKNNIV